MLVREGRRPARQASGLIQLLDAVYLVRCGIDKVRIPPANYSPEFSQSRAIAFAYRSEKPKTHRVFTTVPFEDALLSPAGIAAHGPLYDNITFGNIPRWVTMCTLPFNAYRLASQRTDRAAQNQAVEDILMLPQRVLTRTSRGGGDGKRLTRTIRARC